MVTCTRSSRFALLPLFGLLAAACASSDDRSLVLVDLQLGTGVSPPETVRVSASQSSIEVKSYDIPWKDAGAGPKQVGLFFPSGISGQVAISAKAFTGSVLVAEGQVAELVTLKSGGTVGPFGLRLAASTVSPPVGDGGSDAADGGVSEAGPAPVEVGDTATPNAGLDGGTPEASVPEVPVDVKAGDTAGDVAGPADLPAVGDDAKDALSPADTADATIAPTDTLADTVAPTDAATGGEVGHSPAWEPAQNIENDLLNRSYYSVVAVDPVKEHVYVAWDQDTTIKVKRWNRQSGVWEKTVILENRGNPDSPSIGADAQGNVMVLWSQNTRGATPSVDGVWMSRTTDGTNWSLPVRFTSDPAFSVELVMARNGTGHAAYMKQKSPGWPLHTAYFDGTGWTENPTAVDPNTTSVDTTPQLALNELGDGLLVFYKSWGVAGTVLTGTTYTTPIMLDPNYQTISAYYPAVAMNRKGEGIVVWSEYNGGNTVALARSYNPSVGWSSVTPPLVTSSTVAALAVALDEQSNVTLLWQQDINSGGINLMGKHGTLSGTWSDVTMLETDNHAGELSLTTEYAYPRVAIDGSGNVLAVWRKDLSVGTTTTTYGAYASRFAAGSWLPQAKLGLKTGFNVPDIRVAVADSGFGAATFIYTYGTATAADPDADNVQVAFFR